LLKKGQKITRAPLTTLPGVVVEMGRIYRAMRSGKVPHDEGRSLVWVLSQLRAALESEALVAIEQKLADLETRTINMVPVQPMRLIDGDAHTDSQAGRPN